MRIRKRKWVEAELEQCDFFVKEPEMNKGKWNTLLQKEQPIYLELGCGKGSFASQFGIKNPDINLIAVDIKNDMLGLAKRKIEKVYNEKPVQNILLVCKNVEKIEDLFSKQDKITRIYINFCNPWPRKKHKKRRLTHIRQLEHYKTFLLPGSKIYFKTDDDELFEETLMYLDEAGFEVDKITRDLHSENMPENIITEHETMFSEQGIKIKFLIATYKE